MSLFKIEESPDINGHVMSTDDVSYTFLKDFRGLPFTALWISDTGPKHEGKKYKIIWKDFILNLLCSIFQAFLSSWIVSKFKP